MSNSTLETLGHASAGPFEALAKHANWLGVLSELNCFGQATLATDTFDHVQDGVR